ncbi:MAG: endoribonuclease MazF [Terriglobales bacterium]
MVTRHYVPDAGHLIKIDFDPQTGHEQAGWRPAIVLSPASYNRPTGLAIVAPITNQQKRYPFEVALPAGLKVSGVVLSDAVKNVDWRARNARYADEAPRPVLDAVRERLGLLLGLGS